MPESIHHTMGIRTYAVNVERSCHRPGCRRFVASALAYDIPRRTVWLEDVEFDESVEREAERDGQLLLCALHSDRFQVPVGWQLIDHRSPTRSLWTHEVDELPRRTQPPTATPKRIRKRSSSESIDPPDTLWDVKSPDLSGPEFGPDVPEIDVPETDVPETDLSGTDTPEPGTPTSMRLLDREHPAVDGESIGISFNADSPLLQRAFLAARRAS